MPNSQDLILATALAFAALFFGWLTDAYGWSCFAALGIWSFRQWREWRRLQRWSLRPLSRPTNDANSWQTTSDRLYRSLQRARSRSHNVMQAHKALRKVMETVPDAVLVLTQNGEIDDLNAAARRLLNLDNSDRGHSLASLVRQPDFIALSKGNIDGDRVEFTSTLKESVRLEARRVRMSGNRVLILVRDVTQLNRLLSMRQDFIANVSHELRTPLTVIVGYIETLLDDRPGCAKPRELIEKLQSPTVRMRALVDDLLLLTRLESSPDRREELAPVDMRVS